MTREPSAPEDDARIDLPATSRAVLGILSFEEELSGYDVKRWADQSLAFFYWAPSHSQIYAELRRLEKLGLAVSRVEQTHEAKSRRVYAITDAGRRRIRAWADAVEPEAVILKNPVMLRVWAAHNSDPRTLVRMLQEHRADALERASRAASHAESAAEVPAWHFPSVVLEWSERYYRDEAARVDWLLERLADDVGDARPGAPR